MPIDDLSGSLSVPTRDGERDRWRRDYEFHDPSSDTSEGTQPWIEASTMADAVMAPYHDIKLVGDAIDPNNIAGALLDTVAGAEGVLRPKAVGASGSVKIGASVGGGTIQDTDELTANNLRFRCRTTAHYNDGDAVPIIGVDTGPQTNLSAGTIMRWSSPPAGIAQDCTVVTQPDGSGLTGGRNRAEDDEYRTLWLQERQERAASGNDTEIQQVAEEVSSVAVLKCFTYPAIDGPCTTCLAFVLKPDTAGSSRIPNGTQLAAVLAAVQAAMPANEGIFGATLLAQNVDVAVRITWDPDAEGWVDLVTWPPYFLAQAIVINTATDATHFVLKAANGVYTSVPSPVVGQTIAFYDKTNAVFVRKKILSFTGTGPWTITCDVSNGASDESYVPVASQRAMPWSNSLQDLVLPIQTYFQTLGPGEQVASFFDPGKRQRRQPPSPQSYPSIITEKGLGGAIDSIASVLDQSIAEPTIPLSTTVGTPATTSYLLEMNFISAFPK
jgi:hypothetical protein